MNYHTSEGYCLLDGKLCEKYLAIIVYLQNNITTNKNIINNDKEIKHERIIYEKRISYTIIY